ncbi:MAG TPA: hypothetical protein HPP77_09845 [Candidatus Hydrogenedentes bacterium]|nr:hypothetical protein [Candidatus Hydrogenedentota bacterium]
MRSELKEAIRRIHSEDYQKLVTTRRQINNGSRKRLLSRVTGWNRLRQTPLSRVLKWVVLLVVVVAVLTSTAAGIYYFNRFSLIIVDLNKTRSLIDNQVMRKKDLIPYLRLLAVEYSAHEKALHKYVSEMRGELAKLEEGRGEQAAIPLPDLLSSPALLAIAEKFPDLKATQSIERLMEEWAETENKLAAARADYIETIAKLNGLCSTFPSNMYAMLFRVHKYQPFSFEEPAFGDIDEMREFYTTYVNARLTRETGNGRAAGNENTAGAVARRQADAIGPPRDTATGRALLPNEEAVNEDEPQ